jgi:hypothetical protein
MADDTPTTDLGHFEVIPAGEVDAVEPETEPVAAKKKRRGWIGWLVALVIIAVLVVVAWIVGDNLARSYAEQYVREQVQQVFGLEASKEVDVVIGPGSLIAQGITGSIDSVDVAVDDVTLGPISGDIDIAMTGIPLSADGAVRTLRVTASVPEGELAGLASNVTAADVKSISLVEDRVAIESEFAIFGFAIPVGVELTPVVTDGEIGFEPSVITLNGNEISVAALNDGPFAGLAGTLLSTQSFCVSSYLPQALTVTDVHVEGTALLIDLEADGAALGGTEFSSMGTCPTT